MLGASRDQKPIAERLGWFQMVVEDRFLHCDPTTELHYVRLQKPEQGMVLGLRSRPVVNRSTTRAQDQISHSIGVCFEEGNTS